MADAELVEKILARTPLSAEDLHVVSRAMAPGVADQSAVRALLRIEVQIARGLALLERLAVAAEAAQSPPAAPPAPETTLGSASESKPKRGR